METTRINGPLRPLISQVQNNTTLWIGHSSADRNDHVCGQTFACNTNGTLDNIQVYASSIQAPGDLVLTLHEFDETTKNWGPALTEAHQLLNSGDKAHWIRFALDKISLNKNANYGFRLQTKDAFVGLGEAASKAHHPFEFGCAWNAGNINDKGLYFKYFSLAFKVEMCA
jgi:hypothetical protein